jgi:hypothetical protein
LRTLSSGWYILLKLPRGQEAMTQRSPSLTTITGRVLFINIRNIYASTDKEIRLALLDSTGVRREYEFTASFGESFLDIRRDDNIELIWKDEASRSIHSIKNLRTGTTYALPAAGDGCSVVFILWLLGILALVVLVTWVWILIDVA